MPTLDELLARVEDLEAFVSALFQDDPLANAQSALRRVKVRTGGTGGNRTLVATKGTFTLTGNAATLTPSVPPGLSLTAAAGSFTLTGNDAGLTATWPNLTAASGSFALTGNDADLQASSPVLVAGTGSFTVTGNAVTFAASSPVLTAAAGSFTLTGGTATLTASSLGTLTALAIYYYTTGQTNSSALPVTFTSESQDNFVTVTATSDQGGDVTISTSGVPAGMVESGGTNSLDLSWVGLSYDNTELAEGTYPITLHLADTHANTTDVVLTIVKRVIYNKETLTYLAPHISGQDWFYPDSGLVHQPVSGITTVALKITKGIYGGNQGGTNITVQYYVDGVASGFPRTGDETWSWDTTALENRPYVIEARILNAIGGHLNSYRSLPALFLVHNGAAKTGAYTMPCFDVQIEGSGSTIFDTQNSGNQSVCPDYVSFPGVRTRRSNTHPHTHVTAPPAHTAGTQALMANVSNWIHEQLNHARSNFGECIPHWWLDENGIPFLGSHFPRVATESSAAQHRVECFAHWDGPRNDNTSSEYSVFAAVPGGDGWLGVQINGRVFQVKNDGSIRTICGRAIAAGSTVIPYDGRTVTFTGAQVSAHQETLIAGTYTGGIEFDLPNDIAFHPGWPTTKVVYVADTENRRIAAITFSDSTTFANPVVTTYKDLSTYDADAEPYSCAVGADGTIYVADRDLGQVYKVAPGAGAISHLCDIPKVQVIRLNSLEQLIVASAMTQTVYRVDKTTGTATTILFTTQIYLGPDPDFPVWLWLDVDRYGNIGPTNAIYLTGSITGGDLANGLHGARSECARILVDGSGNFLSVSSWLYAENGGPYTDGQGSVGGNILDPFGHYPWSIAIDDDECRFLATGFGGVGIVSARSWQSGDPTYHGEDYPVFYRGQQIHFRGSVPDFPVDARPSFAAIHGPRGFNCLGSTRCFDDLADLSNAALTTAIQTGTDGSVARPEITGNDLRDYIYYIRRSSLSGFLADIRPGADAADTSDPVISSIVATPVGSVVTITWNTDEATLGYVDYGPDDYYGRWSSIESSYGTSHSRTISDLTVGTWHYRVTAKDSAGNVTRSTDGTFTISASSPVLVAAAGAFTLTGNPATLNASNPVLAAGAGAYTMTGRPATLTVSSVVLTATAGSFTVTGNDATLTATSPFLGADAGSFTLTGNPATLSASAPSILSTAKTFATAAWSLDEASGPRADQVGTSHLTDHNTVQAGTGKFGIAADLEASNLEYLSVTDNAALSMGNIDFMVRCWVKLESKTGDAQYIISKGAFAAGEYELYYSELADGFVFAVYDADQLSGAALVNGFGGVSIGTWYLLHGWYDSVTNETGVSVNGVFEAVDSSQTTGCWNGASELTIGVDWAGRYFDGLIDDVVVLKNRILNSTERTADYNSGTGIAFSAW